MPGSLGFGEGLVSNNQKSGWGLGGRPRAMFLAVQGKGSVLMLMTRIGSVGNQWVRRALESDQGTLEVFKCYRGGSPRLQGTQSAHMAGGSGDWR